MSDTVENSEMKTDPRTVKPRKKRRIWLRIFYAMLILILILCIAGWAVWVNRNMVTEEFTKRYLAGLGYESAFTIDHISDREVEAKNITLSHEGAVFFTADSAKITYVWPDIRERKIESLRLEKPEIYVSFDAQGRINSAWMPESSGGEIVFPPDGVVFNHFKAHVETTLGKLPLEGTVFAQSLEQASIDMKLSETQLSYNGLTGKVSGQFDITRDDRTFEFVDSSIQVYEAKGLESAMRALGVKLDGKLILPDTLESGPLAYSGKTDVRIDSLSHAKVKLASLTATTSGDIQVRVPTETTKLRAGFEGIANATTTSLESEIIRLEAASAKSDGRISFDASQIHALGLDTDLEFSADMAGLADAKVADQLARKITIFETLSKTPVAEHFNIELTQSVSRALKRADWSGQAHLIAGPEGHAVKLTRPLKVKAPAGEAITLRPISAPTLKFNRESGALDLRADIDLAGARAIEFDDFKLSGVSDTGWLWTDIKSVSGDISTQEVWTQGDVRLAPFLANLNYVAGRDKTVRLTSALDYDGPLIGSDFKGLKTAGQLKVTSGKDGLSLGFAANQPVIADSVMTSLGWEARNVSLNLVGDAPLLTRSADGEVSNIAMQAEGLKAHMYKAEGVAQDFAVLAGTADISGQTGGVQELWSVTLGQANIRSETTPGPETQVQAETVTVDLSRAPQSAWQYRVTSPSIDARVKPMTLDGSAIELTGSEGDFTANYADGTVKFDGVDLPALPAKGTAVYAGGNLTGKAETALPRAPRYPIFADYAYVDGQGKAAVTVPEFIFTPSGLQPQDLAPVLRGKIAEVAGLASAKVELGYTPGQPLSSSGSVTLTNMDIGTLVGPFAGVNATLNFDSLFPLLTSGVQSVTMDSFDPGLPLPAGTVEFAVVPGGIDIRRAEWPIEEGAISLTPTIWSTAGTENRVIVAIKDVSLGDLIAQLGNEDISATGKITGTLPIYVDGVTVKVDKGQLRIADGGVISIRLKDKNKDGETSEMVDLAAQALRDFRYDSLTLDVNGPLDGDIRLGAVFTGQNPNVLYGTKFKFNTTVEGELVNIARSFGENLNYQRYLDLLESPAR